MLCGTRIRQDDSGEELGKDRVEPSTNVVAAGWRKNNASPTSWNPVGKRHCVLMEK